MALAFAAVMDNGAMAHRVDTHHHVVPPTYRDWLASKGIDAGGRAIPEWSTDSALSLMEDLDVATAILSVSTPGVHLGDDAEARDMARQVNEFAADVVRDQPERFGFFATLTLPDVTGAIDEAVYALDTLGADGVVLLANVGGVYLGDPRFDDLFDELNRREAVVFIHPSHLAGDLAEGIPAFVADFLLDTTRAAITLCRSGTMDRCRDLKVVLSHAGGIVPYAAHRIAPAAAPSGQPAEGLELLGRFWFDIALSGTPTALPSLLSFADHERILFGSDWPFAPAPRVKLMTSMYDDADLDASLRASIDRANAERLLSRFAS